MNGQEVTGLKAGANELQKLLIQKQKGMRDCPDLYGHVAKTMSHVVRHYPHDALNKFEEVSWLLKVDGGAHLGDFLKTQEHKNYAKPSEDALKEGTKPLIAHTKKLFQKVEEKRDEEGNVVAEDPGAAIGELPDLASDAHIWQWAGVSFGEFELMLLQKSLKALIKSTGATQMRLWGKIRGTECDYYIAEGTCEPPAEGGEEGAPPTADGFEARGTGVNKFAYWACNSAVGDSTWTALPDLSPQDIKNARSIKFCFSGDLNRKLCTNPFFYETEKLYLRAQIARITQSTTLVPKGLYRFVEESTREIEPATLEEGEGGEVPKPSTLAMKSLDMWTHFTPSILKQGRLTHKEVAPAEGEEEGEPDDALKREVAKDPWEPRMKPIGSDAKTQGGMPAWILRSHGADDKYVDPKTNQATLNYGVVVVKSLWWPGAYAMYNQGRTLHIYVGNGQKNEQVTYYPVNPPVMNDERDERPTADEPNPTEEWLAKKAELDAKKAAAGGEEGA